nr:hypothetical protein [uncultured Cetobacterium sp.]
MGYKKSFTELDYKYWGDYKIKIAHSESIEETKKIFSMVVANLVKEAEPNLNPIYREYDGDFEIDKNSEIKFKVSSKIDDSPYYRNLVEYSDMVAVITKYADMAINRIIHQKNDLDKTNGKKIIH